MAPWRNEPGTSECSLEGLMLKLKLQYFGHLMQRADSFEKTVMLGKIEGRRRRGWQRMRWLDGITDSLDMSLVVSRSWWWPGRPGVLQFMGSQRVRHDWATELNWTEQFYEDLQDLLELTPKKDVLFIIGDWDAKVGSQELSGVTGKFGLGLWNEAGQRLIEFWQENALVIANTLFQQHKRRLYIWTSPDDQYHDKLDYILCSQRWRSSIQSAKTRLGDDSGSDHELLLPNSDLN